MEKLSLDRELKENAYPGRGIVIESHRMERKR